VKADNIAAIISIIIPIYKAVLRPCMNGEDITLGIKELELRIVKDFAGICDTKFAGTADRNVDIGFMPRKAEKRNDDAGTADN
jgi:hypothetical protein